jgi:arylsulfatase A-like enzyme
MTNTQLVRCLVVAALVQIAAHCSAAELPNILWLTSEDHGPEMDCYGDKLARTPNIDALAAKGMLFRRAWSCVPVCAPARSAIISGMYPSSTGALHMRSMVPMPAGAQMYPEILRDAGYYCTNNSKEDYNLAKPADLWDESSPRAHWRNRPQGKPFFAIFNSTKSHESQIRTRPHKQVTDPNLVRVPAFHPDTPEVRQDWAQYYDKVSEADADAGMRLKELAEAGLADETIVFYYGDHGTGMPRGKRWPANLGLHVPLVVYFPEKWRQLAPKEYEAAGRSDRMVNFVDLAPTLVSLAGIQPPDWMQGHAFAGPYQTEPQPYLFGERGRMDERQDQVRSVTDGRYVYLRNYFPHVSQAQRVAYQFQTPTTRIWREQFDAAKTNGPQSIFWTVPKAPEELYDLQSDRDEVVNLAGSPAHREVLERMRGALRGHILAIRDVTFLPESEMFRRSRGSTPYDMARDEVRYPLERILAAADLASNLDPAATNKLVELLSDDDRAVRYWGALGILMRGERGVSEAAEPLKKALLDECPEVQIVAAQALAEYGPAADRLRGLAVLGKLAVPATNGQLVAMHALAAIEGLGRKGEPLVDTIRKLDPQGPSPHARYNEYVPRLIKSITGQGE